MTHGISARELRDGGGFARSRRSHQGHHATGVQQRFTRSTAKAFRHLIDHERPGHFIEAGCDKTVQKAVRPMF